jgi:hypothetical protein
LSTAETTTAKGKEKAVPWLLQATSTKTNPRRWNQRTEDWNGWPALQAQHESKNSKIISLLRLSRRAQGMRRNRDRVLASTSGTQIEPKQEKWKSSARKRNLGEHDNQKRSSGRCTGWAEKLRWVENLQRKKSGRESEEHRGNKIKTKQNRNMKTKDSTSWIFHWQPTRRTAVKLDRGKNQGASEAKELIPKTKPGRWSLCSQLTSGGRSCAPRKKISLSQVVTESKQKSFSHVAKTETKNRRWLRNSIGGKTSRWCEKENRKHWAREQKHKKKLRFHDSRGHNKMQQRFFYWSSIKIYTITEVTVIPPSFDYWNENEFLVHFYSRKYEIKLKSGKYPHPL